MLNCEKGCRLVLCFSSNLTRHLRLLGIAKLVDPEALRIDEEGHFSTFISYSTGNRGQDIARQCISDVTLVLLCLEKIRRYGPRTELVVNLT